MFFGYAPNRSEDLFDNRQAINIASLPGRKQQLKLGKSVRIGDEFRIAQLGRLFPCLRP